MQETTKRLEGSRNEATTFSNGVLPSLLDREPIDGRRVMSRNTGVFPSQSDIINAGGV